jgi:hypothetical protein
VADCDPPPVADCDDDAGVCSSVAPALLPGGPGDEPTALVGATGLAVWQVVAALSDGRTPAELGVTPAQARLAEAAYERDPETIDRLIVARGGYRPSS